MPPPRTPPGRRGGTHMSLAGRFLPSTMRMERALRRAMAGGQRSRAEPSRAEPNGAERGLEPAAPRTAPMCGPAPAAANQRAGAGKRAWPRAHPQLPLGDAIGCAPGGVA